MKLIKVKGTTSQTVKIFIQDSSSTTGAGLTGLTSGTSGLTCYYIKEGDSSTTVVSLVSATLGTWTSKGFIVVDGTHMPGTYELGLPDAALTNLLVGGGSVFFYLQGATNMAPCVFEVQLSISDLMDATVASSANVTQWNGHAVHDSVSGYPDINVKYWSGTSVGVNVAGVPIVDVGYWLGQGVFASTNGVPNVNLIAWKNSTPNNLVSGKVDANATVGGTVTVGGYSAGQDPATLVWAQLVDGTYDTLAYLAAATACAAGACSGAPGTPAFLSLDGLTTYVTGSADANGNRFTITYNLP
jgi:hypothetical protein